MVCSGKQALRTIFWQTQLLAWRLRNFGGGGVNRKRNMLTSNLGLGDRTTKTSLGVSKSSTFRGR